MKFPGKFLVYTEGNLETEWNAARSLDDANEHTHYYKRYSLSNKISTDFIKQKIEGLQAGFPQKLITVTLLK